MAICNSGISHGHVSFLIIMTFVFNVESLVSALSVDLIHVLPSLVHKHILDILHVPIACPKHDLASNLWVLLEDLTSKESLAERDGLNIADSGRHDIDEL